MLFKHLKTTPLWIAVLCTGCAGVNDKFGCRVTASNRCATISVVNAQAQAGVFNKSPQQLKKIPISSDYGYLPIKTATSFNGVTPLPGEPVRFGEQVQRVWIAPYQDSANNYHEPSYVYMVLNAAHWAGVPAKEIRDNEDLED